MHTVKRPAPLPFVSVLLPVRNEAAFIERSIGSVLAQDYPADRMEVIVVDGMSSDETGQIVTALIQRHPNVRLIDNPDRIVAAGLNQGIRESQGSVIVRVDGHCEIAGDYIRRCVTYLQRGADGVGGPLETIGETPRAQVIAAAMSSKFGVGDSAFRTVSGRSMLADTVAFPAYRRELIERAGPFDEELVRNQDDEYNYRLRKMGARIFLAADIHARYYSRSSLRSLWKQYLQYGYWKVRVLQKHPLQMRARQFAPPAFVTALGVMICGAPFSSVFGLLLLSLVVVYGLANAAAVRSVIRRERLSEPWLLAVAFATLHIAYGLGFLRGLIGFWNRWGTESSAVMRSAAAEGMRVDSR